MLPNAPSDSQSVFRSVAWVQAWIDIWGKHPALRLIDLGGRLNPLEHVYITRHRLKKIIPINTLSLAGIGYGQISTPRAEYNSLNDLIRMAGTAETLYGLIKPLAWQQFVITDVLQGSTDEAQIKALERASGVLAYSPKIEPAYAVVTPSYDEYLQQLGSNTRLVYFNRRKNLAQQGEVSFIDYGIHEADSFFSIVNAFHLQRWGQHCYSEYSQQFLKNFGARLKDEGGELILQSMLVNRETVSVLVDVTWKGTRYNFQSGYAENRFPKIALGAIHMGYAIENAIKNQQRYDFMAGQGKNSDYKKRIATQTQLIATYQFERGFIKTLRQLQNSISKKASM